MHLTNPQATVGVLDGLPVGPFHPVLRDHNAPYEAVVRVVGELAGRCDGETVLRHVDVAAKLASEFHAGRFADGAIENVALGVGADLDRTFPDWRQGGVADPMPKTAGDGRRRVLHVATQVHGIGGHTRIIWHWARNDRTSRHSLLLTEQGAVPVPGWLREAFREAGGDVVVLPWRSPIRSRARTLRDVARRSADLVVMHHHPSDVVPVVALATPECPPVALLNHADHIFWLGSSVADVVVNLRGVSNLLNGPRRFAPDHVLLPVPLPAMDRSMTREEARSALGIPQEQFVFLTVGRAEKYQPCGPYSFFATAARVLGQHRDAHLYVVGVGDGDPAAKACEGVRSRVHLLGGIENPSRYWAAADVYLESFPFGSQTALLEAGASGLPVVPALDPMFPLLVAHDDAVADLLPNPRTEGEYATRIESLVGRAANRAELGEELGARLTAEHAGEGWLGRLAGVYERTGSLEHRPHALPVTRCQETDLDIGLALWQALRDRGRRADDGDPWVELRRWLFGHACVAKDCRDFRTAMRIHASGGRLCGWNRRSAAAVAKLVPQWAMRMSF